MITNTNKKSMLEYEQTPSLSMYTKTNYLNLLPDEIIEEIINYLNIKATVRLRGVCHRTLHIIDTSSYISNFIVIQKAGKFFASLDKSMADIKAIKHNFMAYLNKYYSVDNKQLAKNNKFDYYAVQYFFANMMDNASWRLQKLCSINTYELNTSMVSNIKLHITTEANKFLCQVQNIFYELILQNNRLTVTQEISRNVSFLYLACRYQNYIVLDKSIMPFKQGMSLFKKIGDKYQDITPNELNNLECKFVEVQHDTQGNTLFVIYADNKFILLNMNDISNYANMHITSIDIELRVQDIQTAKYNNSVLVYGSNLISSRMEIYIYKNIEKVTTFKTRYFRKEYRQQGIIFSPQGDGFAIKSLDYDANTIFYNIYRIYDKEIKEVYATQNKLTLYNTDLFNAFNYCNKGDYILIVKDHKPTMVYIGSNNNTIVSEILNTDFYIFNESGSMLLLLRKNYKRMKLYSYHKGIKEERTITCKDKVHIAKFSPNSQFIATIEKANNQPFANIIRIYKITTIDKNSNIKLLATPKHVATYNDTASVIWIHDFSFNPDGTKIIVNGRDSPIILILEIINSSYTPS